MANMMSKSKYEKSRELDSFKNGLHGIGLDPSPDQTSQATTKWADALGSDA